MNPEMIEKLYELLEQIPVTVTNRAQLRNIRELLDNNDFQSAAIEIQNLKNGLSISTDVDIGTENEVAFVKKPSIEEEEAENMIYPRALMDEDLEETYIGLLLTDPKAISRYYFLHDDCYFANDTILNLYKLVLFADGEAYASELAKKDYNFAKNVETIFPLKDQYKFKVEGRKYDFEKIYVALRKLFILRKNYRRIPIKSIQDKIVDIIDYKLYDQMSIEEIENAVNQAEVTSKFKQSV